MVRPSARAGVLGFTLIELMVTISIMVALLLAAVPLVSDWVYSAQTRDAQAKWVQGFSTAKALALRNPAGVSPSSAAAALRVVTNDGTATLLVCTGALASPGCDDRNGARVYWQTAYPASVTTTPLTLEINHRGTPLSPTEYLISRGGPQNDETGYLY